MKEPELISAINALPGRIRPERDLWPGICTRLESRAVFAGRDYSLTAWRRPAILAAALAVLTTGILIGRGLGVTPVVNGPQRLLEYALRSSRLTLEREYQAAFKELLPLDYSAARLSGADPQVMAASWQAFQQAEAMLLAAIKEYPANTFLSEQLLDLKSRQLQFLKQMVMLEQNNWRTT